MTRKGTKEAGGLQHWTTGGEEAGTGRLTDAWTDDLVSLPGEISELE